MFLGRNEELSKLNKRYENGAFECVVIYGRRRVGKTALINEFCKDKRTIYFSALDTTSAENLRTLSKAIYACMNPEETNAPEYLNYEDAFTDIFQQYTGSFDLISVKTTNMGSLFKLNYHISLKDLSKEKEFIDALRCRNGNLEIAIARQEVNVNEL